MLNIRSDVDADRLGAEGAFLLDCVRAALAGETGSQSLSPTAGPATPDWTRLLALAEEHGVLPLIYQTLRSLPATEPARAGPPSVVEKLRQRYHGNAMRSMTLGMELVNIVQHLEAAGVQTLPVKGVALAALAYDEPTMRQPGDLDLLIRPRDYPRAYQVLTALAYAPHSPSPMSSQQEAAWLHFKIERHFSQTRQQIDLDLHWQLFDRRVLALDFEPLWRRGATVQVHRQAVRTLGADDTLLYLCFHGSKHGWDTLKWLVDVAVLIRADLALTWPVVLERAQALDSQRMLLLGLALARDLLNTDLPREVSANIDQDEELRLLVSAAAARLVRRLHLNAQAHDAGPASSLRAFWPSPSAEVKLDRRYRMAPVWTNLRLLRHQQRGLPSQILHGAANILTPGAQEIRMISLPESLLGVYYAIRLARLLWTAAQRAFALVWRQATSFARRGARKLV